MFGFQELKKRIEVEQDTVECPVIRCENRVKRMTKGVPRSLDAHLEQGKDAKGQFGQYLCARHNIYITPSTFIYNDLSDNLLWYALDKELLGRIMKVKRVRAQLHHDNSEDAVTWNVFRFLERNRLLATFLGRFHNGSLDDLEVIYWSYSPSQRDVWSELEKARAEFGETPQRASEPDLIVRSDNALFFIEAKLTAPIRQDFNENHSKEEKDERVKRYSKHDEYLSRSVQEIIDAGYYQLMRFWLIGSWIAGNENLDFYLVSLVRKNEEEDIVSEFGKFIAQNEKRKFMRITWEDIHDLISTADMTGDDKDRIVYYFKNKTLGYNGKRELEKAFSIL